MPKIKYRCIKIKTEVEVLTFVEPISNVFYLLFVKTCVIYSHKIGASSSSLSGTSSISHKYQNVHNQSHQQDESIKPSKSSLSVTSSTDKTRASVTNSTTSNKKTYLSNSISVHGDVNYLMNHHHNSSNSNTNNNHKNSKGFFLK